MSPHEDGKRVSTSRILAPIWIAPSPKEEEFSSAAATVAKLRLFSLETPELEVGSRIISEYDESGLAQRRNSSPPLAENVMSFCPSSFAPAATAAFLFQLRELST